MYWTEKPGCDKRATGLFYCAWSKPAELAYNRAMAKMPESQFDVECPCCHSRLTIDAKLEEVLSFEAVKRAAPDVDLTDTAKHLRDEEERREAKFRQSVEHEKKKEDLFERLFQENLKKAKEQPVEKPLRDFDLD